MSPYIDPRLVRFGRYIRRSRYLAGRSQEALAEATGVTQSMISRVERALAPSMGVDRLVVLAEGLEPNLPLGFCPHVHSCPWQPLPPDWLVAKIGQPVTPKGMVQEALPQTTAPEDPDRPEFDADSAEWAEPDHELAGLADLVWGGRARDDLSATDPPR